jgi:hypothetical protein
MTANDYLNNTGAGLVDPRLFYAVDTTDRPWQLAFSGLYGLPIGRGGLIASGAHGPLGAVLNEWQLDWIFQNQGGTPLVYPNGYLYNCGDYNIHAQHKSYSSYINNSNPSCWSTFPEYTAVTRLPRRTAIRNPYAQQTALGIEKKFRLTETSRLQFKAEAFNVTNTPIFADPSRSNPQTAPTRNASVSNPNQPGAWSGFGPSVPRSRTFRGRFSYRQRYSFNYNILKHLTALLVERRLALHISESQAAAQTSLILYT